MWTAIIAILAAAQLVLAAPINDGGIKPIEHEPSYVRSPMGRGTMDLMFTCVITLSLCVWTAIHPNIEARDTYMARLRRKALYVVLGLFSPEIVMSQAFHEWREARNLRGWLHRETAKEILENAVEKAADLGGFPYRAYEQTISAHGLMALIRNKVVDPMRLLELRADIKDKGKSDLLAKVLVCAQAVWMMMNCLLRKAAGLPITVIELNVIVHVMSMIAIYACWWNKPHDAGMPIPLNNLLEDQAVCSLLFMRDNSRRSRLMAPIEGTPTALRRGEGEKIRAIKDITRLPDMFEFNRSLVVVLIPLCLIYGGIHASLWNAYFPTPIERWLWRISACIVGIPGLGICVQAWAGLLSKYREQLREVIDVPLAGAIVVTVLSVIVYCGARAFILVETFICLRSLPEGAYKTVRWEEFWPHL
ncbi:hypothetical protein P167DRAFT_497821 [Morchella conica CCBAS932]|uniref:Integral membrane protein n=1 Tax=Morchella conica CCBAS932 TaxID=1392247 RepID=A0A3N4KAD9_9PEZI|nr:hypothetical protein P167DRAFT_497821 [Morchella conica CCBAS932]